METTKLLAAADYVRNETLINGNQAAQLDGLVNAVIELTAHVEQYTAKIADRVANGLNVERLQKWMESAKVKLSAAVESLREWLKVFKANRPNVAINIDDDTTETTPKNDTTMNENTTTTAQEYTHAAQCLYIYLMNESEIYNRYTAPAIERLAKIQAPETFTYWHVMAGVVEDWDQVDNALQTAARLVQKYDLMTPTPADIEAVKANYVAYIIECAQDEVNNA